MFHVKHFFFFLFFGLIFISSAGQGRYTYNPVPFTLKLPLDKEIMAALEVNNAFGLMTDFEQQFAYSLNYARRHPSEFAQIAIEPYLKNYPELRPNYGAGLVRELKSGTELPLYRVDSTLILLARGHATDLAIHDLVSHNSSDGRTTQQRFEAKGIRCGSECINMSIQNSALEVLITLLIDYKVTNVGHRRALLSSSLVFVGVGRAIDRAGKLQYTVVDLSCAP